VFIEHLVEVAHPEEQNGVAILLLGVEVLPHGGSDRRSAASRGGIDRHTHGGVCGKFSACVCSRWTRRRAPAAWRSWKTDASWTSRSAIAGAPTPSGSPANCSP